MNVTFAYNGSSRLVDRGGGFQALQLVPNMWRDPVSFDAPLRQPLRFREAVSALHDTVISDLRFKKRDKTAYLQWKKDQASREGQIRTQAYNAALAEIAAKRNAVVGTDLEKRYNTARKHYWEARLRYSDYLLKHNQELWRMLVPCDPIVTVANDVIFFECFSADESTYGCLTVNREDGFGRSDDVKCGTTNVDYSWDLYRHFQTLRTYRETRFSINPESFAVQTQEAASHREEKIDLPEGWLRGLMQIQSGMTMPMGTVPLSREAVYSILAWLKRNKARKSPRAMRFELLPGKPPEIVIEPWEKRIISHATIYDGPPTPPIRVWGIRRLMVLARVLPLAERFEVSLLGTGLPSFWTAVMGEMHLTVGLSGWTTLDWSRGSAMDLYAPPAAPSPDMVNNVQAVVREAGAIALPQLQQRLNIDAAAAAESLRQLAHCGQVIFDLVTRQFRWRQIMPKALGEAELGPEHPELAAARQIMARGAADLTNRDYGSGNVMVLTGKVEGNIVEILVDADQRIKRGKCICSHYRHFGMKNGPCRHMIALRWRSSVGALEAYKHSSWYQERMKDEGTRMK
jgi:hypothetical protein